MIGLSSIMIVIERPSGSKITEELGVQASPGKKPPSQQIFQPFTSDMLWGGVGGGGSSSLAVTPRWLMKNSGLNASISLRFTTQISHFDWKFWRAQSTITSDLRAFMKLSFQTNTSSEMLDIYIGLVESNFSS